MARIEAGLKRVFPDYGAPVVPVVRLSGTIGRVSRFQSGLTLAERRAAPEEGVRASRSAPAVALVINSPGGSPVQSHLIYKRIRALAAEKEKTVIVFVEDVCASGGYMIACAGDEIVVDPASIVGSIGVVTAGFGFVDAMRKIGVERRVYTSGESKVILDPFQPEKPEDVARLRAIQEEVHDHFIEIVQHAPRRGARQGQGARKSSPASSGRGRPPSRSGSPTASATSARCCASATARRCGSSSSPPSGASSGAEGNRRSAERSAARPSPNGCCAELDERALWERYRL